MRVPIFTKFQLFQTDEDSTSRIFYITNEVQLIQCSSSLSALYMFRAVFSENHQDLIKLYVQPKLNSSNPSTPEVDSRKA
jgi:hypothetical protein